MHATLTNRALYAIGNRLVWAEAFMLVVLFVGYVYFISASIMNVVLRQEAAVEISSIHSSISELDAKYLSRKQAIDEAFARENGFTAPISTHYVTTGESHVSKRD